MKFIYLLFLIVSTTTCFYGQNKAIKKTVKNKSQILNRNVRIDSTKPAVYIDFVRIGEGEKLGNDESKEQVYLKLVNNSKWSIYVAASGNGKETFLYHKVERERERSPTDEIDAYNEEVPKGYRQIDLRSPDMELKSGQSVNFSVPRNHLTKNLKIRIDFYFDWEDDSDGPIQTTKSLYPPIESSVVFYSSNLETFLKMKNNKSS